MVTLTLININDDDKKRIIITITFPEVVFPLTPRDLTGSLQRHAPPQQLE